jgi:predicted Kef-type K+ transport protein
MMVVAGALGVKMELITDSMNDALILTAVTASIIFPSLFRVMARRIAKEEISE